MLDIEITVAASDGGTDVVSRSEMKRHLRISSSNTAMDAEVDSVINQAFDKLHGIGGELNRTIARTTYTRYLKNFPGLDEDGNPKPIMLPFGPVISLDAIEIGGESPSTFLEAGTDYVFKSGNIVPEIHPVSEDGWPVVESAPRLIAITYTCGEAGDYPERIKRMIKILAAHYFENIEATINEPRQMMINRRVEFALDDLRAALKIVNSYDDWNE